MNWSVLKKMSVALVTVTAVEMLCGAATPPVWLNVAPLGGAEGDAEAAADAQRHPEKYENLQVRVCGWNVRWNDIPRVEQDKYIARAESIAD